MNGTIQTGGAGRVRFLGVGADCAIRVLLFAMAAAILCPFRYWAVSDDLDNSWLFGLNYAAAHGLAGGRDILSTTGPLVYLTAPMDIGNNLRDGLWFQAALWLVLAAVLGDLYFRAGARLRNLDLFTVLLSMSSPLFWFNRVGLENVMLVGALTGVMVYRLRGGIPRLLTALVLIGIVSMVKFTSGFIALGAMAGFLVERAFVLRWRVWKEAALVVLAPVLVGGTCLAMTTPPGVLGEFLKAAAEVSGGYSAAMSNPGSPFEIYAAVAALLLVGVLLLVNARSGRVPTVFLSLLLAAPLAVSMKHGFVRQDQHVLNLFCFCALAMALTALSLRLEAQRLIATAGVLLLFLPVWVFNVIPFLDPLHPEVARQFQAAQEIMTGVRALRMGWEARDLARLRSELLGEASRNAGESQRIEPALRAVIGDKPVGFLATSFALPLVLDKVHLALFPPIFPSEAYTPWLDEVSARWVRERGPRFLLFDGTTIDHRNIWAEMPAAWNEVYRWYDARMAGKIHLLLERRASPRFARFVSLQRWRVALKDGFTMPPSDAVLFWTMTCRLNSTGRLNKLLWRVPPFTMDAERGDGQSRTFRLVMDVMVNPVMASLPSGIQQFAQIFDREPRTLPAVKRIEFGKSPFSRWQAPDAALASYEPNCDVEFLQAIQ